MFQIENQLAFAFIHQSTDGFAEGPGLGAGGQPTPQIQDFDSFHFAVCDVHADASVSAIWTFSSHQNSPAGGYSRLIPARQRLSGSQRQGYHEPRPTSRFAANLNLAAVRFHDTGDETQAQAQTLLRIWIWNTIKSIENVG